MSHVEQPMPVVNASPSVQDMVRADLGTRVRLGPTRWRVADDIAAREQVGIERYGSTLQPFNGRDCLRDALEEVEDALCYLRQAVEEAPEQGWDVRVLGVFYERALSLACELRGFLDAPR